MILYCQQVDLLVILLGLDFLAPDIDAFVDFGGDVAWIDSGHLHNFEFVGWL